MIVSNAHAKLVKQLNNSQVVQRDRMNDPYGNTGLLEIIPTTERELADVLTLASEEEHLVTVEGAGTKRGFAGTLLETEWVVSLQQFTGIVDHSIGDMTVTVKAGTPLRKLQKELAIFKQALPFDMPCDEAATIGGMIATNESGPKRLRHGAARDHVIGLRVVYPDGRIIRTGGKVVKNVAGYDMNKLFIGSMGTLGVMTEVTLKLRPLPKDERVIIAFFNENQLTLIEDVVVSLLDSYMEPVALEIMNSTWTEAVTGEVALGLLISFEDIPSSVHYQEQYVLSQLPKGTNAAIFQREDANRFWDQWRKRESSQTLDQSNQQTAVKLKVAVKNFDLFSVLQECKRLTVQYHVSTSFHGGVGHGLGVIILTGDEQDICLAIADLRQVIAGASGHLVLTHAPLTIRQTVDVWGEPPAYMELLQGIKQAIDPQRILNRTRFVGGI